MFPRRRTTSAAFTDSDTDSDCDDIVTLWTVVIKYTTSPETKMTQVLGNDDTTIATLRAVVQKRFAVADGYLKYEKVILADNVTLHQLHHEYATRPLTLHFVQTQS